MIRMGAPGGGIKRASVLPEDRPVNRRGAAAGPTYTAARERQGNTRAAVRRGPPDLYRLRAESRGAADPRAELRRPLGRRRDLEPVPAVLGPSLLDAEGRDRPDPLRDVPPAEPDARVPARERRPGARPRAGDPVRGTRRIPADRRGGRGGGRRPPPAPLRGAEAQ